MVLHRLFVLLLDRAAHKLLVAGLERELPRHEHEAARLDRLRIRRPMERRRRSLRAADVLVAAQAARLRGRIACASATPRALKIASSTCCVSLPSIRRTWSVAPALSASWLRKRAARSVASPPTRASER